MAIKKSRQMKVDGQSGYHYKSTPAIMLKGQWLKELGFEIGDYISVSCENGKLIIDYYVTLQFMIDSLRVLKAGTFPKNIKVTVQYGKISLPIQRQYAYNESMAKDLKAVQYN